MRGRRVYGAVELATDRLTLAGIPAATLSPADITALAGGSDRALYGGGILTMSHLLRVEPRTGASALLQGAVPNAEGQVNAWWAGRDGTLYGVGYPAAVACRFDPALPWNPGAAPECTPLNLGPLDHGGQARARHGLEDADGLLWFQSTSDYTDAVTHAVAQAVFAPRRVDVRTDAEPGLPSVDDLAGFGRDAMLLLGRRNGRPGRIVIDRRTMQVIRERPLSRAGGLLASRHLHDVTAMPWHVRGRNLYRLEPDLSLRRLHRALGPITNVLAADSGAVLLVGTRHVEHFSVDDRAPLWWRAGGGAGDPIVRDRSWTPVAVVGDALYVGDGVGLLRLYRPEACRSIKEAA